MVAAGASILEEPTTELGLGDAFRAVGPLGLVFEIYTGMEREAQRPECLPPLARRLGHLSFAAPDCTDLREFLIEGLGFRVSDSLSDRVCWLRCDHQHHGIALVNSDVAPSMHHYAFELPGWGAIERYADGLAHAGAHLDRAGCHGPGRNLYTYVPDRDGTLVEVYADMLDVESEAAYEPIDWSEPGDQALNLWGPLPPADWRHYGVPILGLVGEAARR